MPMLSKLKVGLIGCGVVALSVHLKNLLRLPDLNLVALADADAQRRQQASHFLPRAECFENYQDLLTMPGLDAVMICLPNALHAEATIAALNAGKHVYLEKPFALNVSQAEQMVEVWQSSGLVGMMGFNYRYNPLYQQLRQAIHGDRIGEIVLVRSHFSTAAKVQPQWKQTRQSGGGVLLDLASHHIDLIRFLLGEAVTRVTAQVRSMRSEEDTATLTLRLANDVLVQSSFSLSAVEDDRIEIYGVAGKLVVDHYRSLTVERVPIQAKRFHQLASLGRSLQTLAHFPYLVQKLRSPWHEPSFHLALTQFVRAIRYHQPVTPSFWDGYQTQRVLAAAEQSMQTGQLTPLSTPRYAEP